MAASSVPSPLYALYREHWGFSAAALTGVFAVYAASLLVALLTLGSLSDHLGRRRVILGAVVGELLSLCLFLVADSVAMLVAARLVQGAATGVALSALGAAILDSDRHRAPLINSAAPMLGMAVGALGSSLLVAHAPAPMRTVYVVVIVALLVQGWAARRLPETVVPRAGAWASLRPRIAIPRAARRAFLLVMPVDLAVWALGGFFLSLGPTLARQVTGLHSPLVGGVLLATLTTSGAVSTLLLRAHDATRLMRIASVTLTLGVGLVMVALATGSIAAFFLGTLTAGVGFGVGFLAALRTVLATVSAAERAGLMAAFLVLSYCAFSLPALAAGFAAGRFGLTATAEVYGVLLIPLALLAGLGTWGGRRPH
ncbi:MFS transporter [Xylophilus sp. Kf1]|nr:MFS transporter [Xylophilus sp. Kf1]